MHQVSQKKEKDPKNKQATGRCLFERCEQTPPISNCPLKIQVPISDTQSLKKLL